MKILVDKEIKRKLKEAFNVSHVTVDNALSCKTRSPLSDRIRKHALDLGAMVKGRENIKVL